MYSFKRLVTQEPAQIVSVIALANAVVLAFHGYSMDAAQLAAVSALVLATLNLAYVRQLTVTRSALQELQDAQPPV